MSASEPLPMTQTTTAEDIIASSAVVAVMEKANIGAAGVIEFESNQTNLIHYYGLKLRGAVSGICGIPVNPTNLSATIASIQQLRNKQSEDTLH